MSDTIQGEQSSPSLQERLRDEYDRNAMTIFRTAKEAADVIDRLRSKLKDSQSESARLERELAKVRNASHEEGVTQIITEESLRAKLAAKDKRIEELESEAAVPAIAAVEAALKGHFFTDEQINAAWGLRKNLMASDEVYGIQNSAFWFDKALAFFGIVACDRCGGTKRIREEDAAYPDWEPCDCRNNGWVIHATT